MSALWWLNTIAIEGMSVFERRLSARYAHFSDIWLLGRGARCGDEDDNVEF